MEAFRYIEQNNPVNCKLNNNVDEDVQLMLWPLNLMPFLSFAPRYRIKNNYITPNSFISNFFSMIGAIVFIFVYIFRTYMQFRYKDIKYVTVTYFADCIYYCIGFTVNFVTGIIQTKNNVEFVLTFQRVHRFLNNETSFSHFIIWNWIMVIMSLCCFSVAFFYFFVQLAFHWIELLAYYLIVAFDLNVVYAIRLIHSLQGKLELWNIQVVNSLEMEVTRDEDFCKRMFQAYADILECYEIYKVCFQPYILYYIMELFLHSLIYIQVIIDTLKEGFMNNTTRPATLMIFLFLSWLSKISTWQTMLMQRCESFYIAVQSAGDTCAVVLKSNCSDEERKMCKNVLRLHRASFSKMRLCGLFYADMALQLSLMALLVNYTVVLLQFAFL